MNNSRWMPPLGWGGTLVTFGAAGALAAAVPRFVMPPVLAFASIWLLRQEALDGTDIWRDRLRFRAMTASDWRVALIAAVLVGVAVALLRWVLSAAGTVDVISALGVLSQEVLWRGVMLPRQEAALGDRAWIASAVGSTLFCLPMGISTAVALLPMFVVLPWLVQRRRNSWIGVIIAMAGALT